MDHSGTLTEARLYYGGMAAKTARAAEAETFLLGKKWTEANVRKASRIIGKEFTPISDARSSAEGRKLLSENLLIKFWEDTKHLSS
jgi:xanthine dehydrogenase small subunit